MSNPRPFNIKIFVAEGLPDGLRLVEKSGWVGLGVVCPRSRYPHVKKREVFAGSGVYLLIGPAGDDDRPTVYVGEADAVRQRLDSHHANKDFWQQAIVFTTKGDPLNKAEIQHLEARLVALASAAKRCKLDNANTPQLPNLSESERAQVDGYLEEMLSLLPVIGIHVFHKADAVASHHRLYRWKGTGWDATGFESDAGFVVKAGSLARGITVPSMQEHVPSDFNKRQSLIVSGVLTKKGDKFVFSSDHLFSSPSQAAAVCAGRSANGRVDWKDAKGVTLKKHQEQEAEA